MFSSRRKPAGHRNKLYVNPSAAMACAGCGWARLSEAAEEVAARSLNIDDAAPGMSDPLRQTAVRMCRDPHLHPADTAGTATVVAGWSNKLARVIAYELRGHALFVPVMTNNLASPAPEGWTDRLQADDPASLADVAYRQLAKLRETYPEAVGGTLSLAIVRPGHVEAGPFLDFASGRYLWRGLRELPSFELRPTNEVLAEEAA